MKQVSQDKWRDAIKFLMGLGTNPTLTVDDQKQLSKVLRGPFKDGMSMAEAQRFLHTDMGWRPER